MANLAARMPSRPVVGTSGGEFELRGLADKLGGDAYIPMSDPTGDTPRTMLVSPRMPIKEAFADAPPGSSGDFSASRRRLLDSVDNYKQDLQGKTPDERGSRTTPKSKSAVTDQAEEDGTSPTVEAGLDYNTNANWKRFNEGETSAKGSTAMRANRSAHVLMDAKQKTIELARNAKQIDTILSQMAKKDAK